MNEKRIPQIELIKETDGKQFQEKLNGRLKELGQITNLTFPEGNGFCAMICYETIIQESESVEDEYYLNYGKRYVCNDCPFLELDPDRRSVTHWCTLQRDRVRLNSSCCDDFYRGLLDGYYAIVTNEERKRQFDKMNKEDLERRKLLRYQQQQISKWKRKELETEKELMKIAEKRIRDNKKSVPEADRKEV